MSIWSAMLSRFLFSNAAPPSPRTSNTVLVRLVHSLLKKFLPYLATWVFTKAKLCSPPKKPPLPPVARRVSFLKATTSAKAEDRLPPHLKNLSDLIKSYLHQEPFQKNGFMLYSLSSVISLSILCLDVMKGILLLSTFSATWKKVLLNHFVYPSAACFISSVRF